MKNGLSAFGLGLFLCLNSLSFAEENPPPAVPAPDAELATPVELPPPTEASAVTPPPAEPTPSAQVPIPVTSIPGKTKQSPSAEAPPPPKDIYEEYKAFQARERDRTSSEYDYTQRNLFPHEDGGWQFGIEYAHNAFSGYNFNFKAGQAGNTGMLGNRTVYADTQGAILSLGYFPIRSLSIGRLGFIGQAGLYFSKFSIDTPKVNQATGAIEGIVKDDVKRQQAVSYGVRAVYEFQYFLGQMFVPFITVGLDLVRMQPYKVAVGNNIAATEVLNIPANNITSQSYGAGLNINLNRIEPVVASRALVAVGVKKFYLSYLALQRTGTLSGLTHSLGLRFEF